MLNIAVVGAGIGGLSAGIMLRNIGCEVTIFEKLSQKSPGGVGIQISANGIRALREYGLAEKISELGDLPDCIDFINGCTGDKVARIPLGKTAEKLYGAG
ncbi:MAG: FAD-dependent monooxygenase, partial [Pseudomonadota bacterium]|nr:FAD-dependent monooxygenase [Pseudomonadota bacterium]